MRRKIAAGNWKMNGTKESRAVVDELAAMHPAPDCDVLICPPAPLIPLLAGTSPFMIGAQDCHAQMSGAHTGDVSAELLVQLGAGAIIVGHSERRADHGESSEDVQGKAVAAMRAGAIAVVCVGETESERDAGQTLEIVGEQLKVSVPADATSRTLVLAYEPVWAIGTGRVPTNAQIAEVHQYLREALNAHLGAEADGVRILYGGSVKPGNAAEIFAIANVDGGLVGGASLKSADFGPIITAAEA